MYACIYIYIYIYMCICIDVFTCIRIYIYMHMYLCFYVLYDIALSLSLYIYIYIYMCYMISCRGAWSPSSWRRPPSLHWRPPTPYESWAAPRLRTNGVNTNGVTAKVLFVDGFGTSTKATCLGNDTILNAMTP